MKDFFDKISKLFRYIMPLFYLAVGLMLIFTNVVKEESIKIRLTLGILLVAYGIFRGWRIYKDQGNQEENETTTD